MKIKSLLAAVSMAALTASSASALEIPAGNVVPTGIIPALELQLPGNPALSGTFTFTLDTETGNYPNGNNILVTVNLPTGIIFSNTVTGASVTSANAQAVVNGGGTTGSNTVTLLVSLDDAFNANTLGFAFDLGLNACPTAGGVVEVLAATEGGTNIEEGRATTADIIAPCQSALDGVVMSDATVSDTQITLASNYTGIAEFNGTGPLNAVGTVGSVNYTIDPTVTTSLAAVTPLAVADIADINFDVAFENAAAITGVTVGGIAGVKTGNVFRFNVSAAADIATLTDGTADDVVITVNGTTVIPTQTVSVTNARVDFRTTGAPDMILSEAGATGSLDTLQREGRSFGFFDWNSGGTAAGNISVYRITGLTGPTDFTVEIENSNANGTYAGTVTPDATGEAVLFSTDMGGVLPATISRFDALLNLETANTNVDVDRLLLSASNGTVTSFGDGANNSYNAVGNNLPNFDSDQTLGSE